MTLADKIVEFARKEIGVREEGGNNLGSRIVVYQQATWLEPGPWPWCAAFTAWILKEATAYLGMRHFKRCKDASAFGWEKWARECGHIVLPETAACEAGDFVVFDFSHIGIVELASDGPIITCIEGNTNGRGERDSISGDGVWRKERKRELVKSFIRLTA